MIVAEVIGMVKQTLGEQSGAKRRLAIAFSSRQHGFLFSSGMECRGRDGVWVPSSAPVRV